MNPANRIPASPRISRTLRALGLAAAVVLATAAHGQGCSGGNAGGTDATGNQCNDPAAVAADGDRSANAPTPAVAAIPANPAASAPPATSPAPMKAAAHRKKVFDERRARFADAGQPRIAAAPAPATVTARPAP